MTVKRPSAKKRWTILVYAAGQNELSPEIFRCFTALAAAGAPKNMTIAVQLARASPDLLQRLRQTIPQEGDAIWSGVKRFILRNQTTEELADLGAADMSQPEILADFLTWGLKTYPADKVMVVLSGHGAGFIGMLSDFSRGHRSLMSLSGLTAALAKSMDAASQSIDILALDACHMQMVEIWYELACLPAGKISYLLTPLGHLRLEGMAIDTFIRALGEGRRRTAALEQLITYAARTANAAASACGEIMVTALDERILRRLKLLAGMAARRLPANGGRFAAGSTLSLVDLFANPHLAPLKHTAYSLVGALCRSPGLARMPAGQNLGPSLLSPAARREYLSFQPHYDTLRFAQENEWTKLLQGDAFPLPIAVPLASIVATMLNQNTGLTYEAAWNHLRELGWLSPPALTAGGVQPSRSLEYRQAGVSLPVLPPVPTRNLCLTGLNKKTTVL